MTSSGTHLSFCQKNDFFRQKAKLLSLCCPPPIHTLLANTSGLTCGSSGGFKAAYAWECSLVWPVAGITSMNDHTWFSQDFVVASVMRVGYLNIHFLGGKIWLESLSHYWLVNSKVNLYNFIPTKIILLIGNGIRLENLVIWLWTLMVWSSAFWDSFQFFFFF